MNIIFNSLLAQLVKYDVHTTRKIKLIHAIFNHISLLYCIVSCSCAAVILMEGGTEFDLKAIDVEDETNRNRLSTGSDKQPNNG